MRATLQATVDPGQGGDGTQSRRRLYERARARERVLALYNSRGFRRVVTSRVLLVASECAKVESKIARGREDASSVRARARNMILHAWPQSIKMSHVALATLASVQTVTLT